MDRHLTDPHTGRNSQFPCRISLASPSTALAGYEDTNDAERLAEDTTFRMMAFTNGPNTRYFTGRGP